MMTKALRQHSIQKSLENSNKEAKTYLLTASGYTEVENVGFLLVVGFFLTFFTFRLGSNQWQK